MDPGAVRAFGHAGFERGLAGVEGFGFLREVAEFDVLGDGDGAGVFTARAGAGVVADVFGMQCGPGDGGRDADIIKSGRGGGAGGDAGAHDHADDEIITRGERAGAIADPGSRHSCDIRCMRGRERTAHSIQFQPKRCGETRGGCGGGACDVGGGAVVHD